MQDQAIGSHRETDAIGTALSAPRCDDIHTDHIHHYARLAKRLRADAMADHTRRARTGFARWFRPASYVGSR